MKYLRPTRHKRRLAIALLLAGLVLCIWQSARLAHEQALNNLRDDARNELRLSAANLRGYLLRYDYLPQMLASRETVKRFLTAPEKHDAMPLNLQLDRFRFTAGVSDVYLLDHDGTTVAASNWHRDDTFIGESYAFRPYYKQAIAGGEGRFYGLGTQSLARGYYFSAPVWLDHTARMPARKASWWSRYYSATWNRAGRRKTPNFWLPTATTSCSWPAAPGCA